MEVPAPDMGQLMPHNEPHRRFALSQRHLEHVGVDDDKIPPKEAGREGVEESAGFHHVDCWGLLESKAAGVGRCEPV
jgi:hypothetical protein